LSVRRPEKTVEEILVKKQPQADKLDSANSYSDYSDFTIEICIDCMLEHPQEHGLVTKVAKDLNINYRTALRWWHYYIETVAYKKFELNSGSKSSFTTANNEYINKILDDDPQLYSYSKS
jgi:hypothetical protein